MTSETPNHQATDPAASAERLDAWLALVKRTAASEDVRLPMLTGSMLPAIPPGATLVITPRSAGPFRRGEVVVFGDEDRLIAHRLLLRLRLPGLNLIFEKGDNNPRGGWIRPDRIRGVVREAILADGERRDPHDPAAATRSLWHLLRHWWWARRRGDVTGEEDFHGP